MITEFALEIKIESCDSNVPPLDGLLCIVRSPHQLHSDGIQLIIATVSSIYTLDTNDGALNECLKCDNGVNKLVEWLQSSQARFQWKASNVQDTILIQVRETNTQTGVVVLIWSTELHLNKQLNHHDVCVQLAHSVRDRKVEQADLKSTIQNLERGMEDWKDTAEKLKDAWEKEKAELLQNFLNLYNMRCEEVQRLRGECQALQETIQKMKEDSLHNATKSAGHNQHNKKAPLPECLMTLKDDRDELYDPELVARLAAGPQSHDTSAKKRPRSRLKEAPDNSRDSSKYARMPVSRSDHGGVEYYDGNALVNYDSLFASSRILDINEDDSYSDESQSRKQRSQRKEESSNDIRQTKLSDSVSYTGTVHEETEIQNSIMAQLEALKNSEYTHRKDRAIL
jgi:hypothetical protein